MKVDTKHMISVTRFVDGHHSHDTEYFTKVRPFKNFIHLLVCAGYNEDDDNNEYYIIWRKTNFDGAAISFRFEQHLTNFTELLKDAV